MPVGISPFTGFNNTLRRIDEGNQGVSNFEQAQLRAIATGRPGPNPSELMRRSAQIGLSKTFLQYWADEIKDFFARLRRTNSLANPGSNN